MNVGGARTPNVFQAVAAGALASAVAALVIYDARYHEFWRDEVHTYLFNEHVPLHRFLVAKKVEGHPPLYDLLTVPLVGIVSPLHRLLIGGAVGFAVLLYGTYRAILSVCCRPVASAVLTALLGATYIYTYELGVVVRCYGLGAGLALLCNGYLREALRGHTLRPVLLGTAAGGACLLASTHASTLAGGSLAAFALVSLWRHRGVKLMLPTIAVLPCLAVAAYTILPFPGRSGELNVDLHRTRAEFTKFALQALAGGLTPQDWWVTASFGSPRTLDVIALLRHWGRLGVLYGAGAMVLLRALPPWRAYRPLLVYDVLAVSVAWAALLEIVVNHYWGSSRHHVFFGIPVAVMLAGWSLQRGPPTTRWTEAAGLAAMAPWLAFQLVVCFRDLALDVDLPFSDTKAAALMLPPDAHLVADSLTIQEGYMLWRPGITMRGGDNGGRRIGYVAFDNAWHAGVALLPMVRDECSQAPDRTYYSGGQWGLGGSSGCLHLTRSATPHSEQLRPDELFDLWKVDCACVGGIR
jgi:hypothetical protein